MATRPGLLAALLLLLVALLAGPPVAVAAGDDAGGRQVLVVDDDGQQCSQAGFASVQAAVDAADAGALVRVCPGRYPGPVRVDKPLTLLGRPEAVAGVDCFAPDQSATGDLDPATYPILQRPDGQPGNLVTVAAPGVTLAGLVLEGATTVVPEGPSIYDAAVHLTSASAPARVRHNLIRLSDLGIDLGSDGSAATRVDHNCLRDNGWGMASQRQDFVGGRVDHNQTFGHAFSGYEVGWSRAQNVGTTYDANDSRQDATGFLVANSSAVTITGNRISGGTRIGVQFLAGGAPTQDVAVTGNVITHFVGAPGFAIGVGTDAQGRPSVVGAVFEGNTLTGNNIGLAVQPNNVGVIARANVAGGNLQYGIFSRARAVGGRYEGNTMLGNGVADARDDNRSGNTWTGNVCETDIPAGTICGR